MSQPPIDNAYWLKRWKESDTGWHQDAPEGALAHYFADLKPTRVLVPLCGKSLDLAWLASQGHDVVGVELSELAIESFFKEQGLGFELAPHGPFKQRDHALRAYSRYLAIGAKITILNGDFFQLKPADISPFGALYDRAALIALPPDLRARYVAKIRELVKASGFESDFRFLQLLLERVPPSEDGPPFSITEKMLRSYYESDFELELLKREDADLDHPSGDRFDQAVYRLSLR